MDRSCMLISSRGVKVSANRHDSWPPAHPDWFSGCDPGFAHDPTGWQCQWLDPQDRRTIRLHDAARNQAGRGVARNDLTPDLDEADQNLTGQHQHHGSPDRRGRPLDADPRHHGRWGAHPWHWCQFPEGEPDSNPEPMFAPEKQSKPPPELPLRGSSDPSPAPRGPSLPKEPRSSRRLWRGNPVDIRLDIADLDQIRGSRWSVASHPTRTRPDAHFNPATELPDHRHMARGWPAGRHEDTDRRAVHVSIRRCVADHPVRQFRG
jgi:hypothetical protein